VLRLGDGRAGTIGYEMRALRSVRAIAGAVRLWQHSWPAQMREADEDHWWDWRDFLARTVGRTDQLLGFDLVTRAHPTLARFTRPLAGEHLQGLMLVEPRWESPERRLETRIWYLASAPWNRPDRKDAHRLAGVGSALLGAAVRLSLDSGNDGVICLVPYVGALGFYRGLGFRRRITVESFDAPRRDLVLDPAQARELVQRVGAAEGQG